MIYDDRLLACHFFHPTTSLSLSLSVRVIFLLGRVYFRTCSVVEAILILHLQRQASPSPTITCCAGYTLHHPLPFPEHAHSSATQTTKPPIINPIVVLFRFQTLVVTKYHHYSRITIISCPTVRAPRNTATMTPSSSRQRDNQPHPRRRITSPHSSGASTSTQTAGELAVAVHRATPYHVMGIREECPGVQAFEAP